VIGNDCQITKAQTKYSMTLL